MSADDNQATFLILAEAIVKSSAFIASETFSNIVNFGREEILREVKDIQLNSGKTIMKKEMETTEKSQKLMKIKAHRILAVPEKHHVKLAYSLFLM